MRLLSVTLERFGSFREKQTLVFPAEPGLYFMRGRNLAEPDLGENGAGKTTVWRAITWAFFGKDQRGLRAGDVANWTDPKGARVSVEFEVVRDNNWMGYSVERTHAPNSWTLTNAFGEGADLARDEANALRDFLRLEYEPWLNCVLMAQGAPMFFDMRPEPQAALFASVLGIDRWLGYSKRAAELADAAGRLARAAAARASEARARADELARSDIAGERDRWEDGRNDRYDEACRTVSELAAREPELHEACAKAETEVTGLNAALRTALNAQSSAQAAYDDAVIAERAAWERMNAARSARSALGTDAPRECPTCRRPLAEHAVVDLREAARRASAELTDADAKHVAAELDLKDAAAALRAADLGAIEADDARLAWIRTSEDARHAWESNEKRMQDAEGDAIRAGAEVNPLDAALARQRADSDDLADRAATADAEANAHGEREELMAFWVRGFKEVRLHLIAEALGELTAEANSEMAGLGLDGWELSFEVDREGKDGQVRRGFAAFVRSPHNSKPVPWLGWSGGEAQRLRVAAQAGFANLVRATTGADVSLEVWDEPTAGLSERGVTDLMEMLARRARDERRQVWVVDHRSPAFGGFAGGAVVVKDGRGSRFEADRQPPPGTPPTARAPTRRAATR